MAGITKKKNINAEEQFQLPIIKWQGDEPKIEAVGFDDYLRELKKYAEGEIAAYFTKDKVAYVVLTHSNHKRFQVIELLWSDRQLPYFDGYFLQNSLEAAPSTRKTVFNPKFVMALQDKLNKLVSE